QIRPGMIAGALFAFITSFDEVVVAVFISGFDSTLPKKMFDEIRFELNPVLAAIATLLIAATTVILLMALQFRRSDQDQLTAGERSGRLNTRVRRRDGALEMGEHCCAFPSRSLEIGILTPFVLLHHLPLNSEPGRRHGARGTIGDGISNEQVTGDGIARLE